ncbi:MAG: exonuclease domain-containing protein [Anaerolineaceae bacterium]|nr:exonuclease domain-containing protein [Anaerolineaceae bacterium]MDD5367500.1 exonuclease domain-containing protein [Anaerolineaceae bacterium]
MLITREYELVGGAEFQQMGADFIALDVETANPNFASICQIGIAFFKDGAICATSKTFIDPQDYFDDMNVFIHGITEERVAGAPTFPDFLKLLRPILENQIVVHHTAFDKASFRQAAQKYNLPELDCRWLDTARVARRTWETYRYSGYGLGPLAERLSIQFQAHDALEDARACGEILLRAIQTSGISLADWLELAPKSFGGNISQSGNPDGPLAGEVIVFTGELSLKRAEAAKIAAKTGCDVADGVNKATTILVVGDQDIKKLAGQLKSSKHRKAESLIGAGQAIRIIAEKDFLELVKI